VCAVCDSSRLRSLRVGVTRVAEELSALTKTRAVEVSGPSGSVEVDARLVVGTEAALHRVGRADVVAFLDFDQHLLAPRFAASEEALALLARAARLVGGRDGSGRLLVQTRIPDHEVLQAAAHADPERVSDPERRLRRSLRLPPFGALALLSGPGGTPFADQLASFDGITVSTIARSSTGADRWLVRARDHRVLCDALDGAERPAERLRVEVDPGDV
jgi:primosomal protein N' (replication factor Y) (superfamily II helicase)